MCKRVFVCVCVSACVCKCKFSLQYRMGINEIILQQQSDCASDREEEKSEQIGRKNTNLFRTNLFEFYFVEHFEKRYFSFEKICPCLFMSNISLKSCQELFFFQTNWFKVNLCRTFQKLSSMIFLSNKFIRGLFCRTIVLLAFDNCETKTVLLLSDKYVRHPPLCFMIFTVNDGIRNLYFPCFLGLKISTEFPKDKVD